MKITDCLTPGHREIAGFITWICVCVLIVDICSDSGGA